MSTEYVVYNVLAMGVFYLMYRVLFSKLTFFQLNRWLILVGVFLITVFPWLSVPMAGSVGVSEAALVVQLDEVLILHDTGVRALIFDHWVTLATIYFIGVGFALIRMGVGIAEVIRVIHKARVDLGFGLPILRSDEVPMAFSFFGWIVLPEKLDSDSAHHVVQHETVHLKQYHTLDRLFLELTCAMLWFNPFAWLMRKELVKIHEFIADEQVTRSSDNTNYQESLLNLSVGDNSLAAITANSFSNPSLTKTRFDMMNKQRTKNRIILRYTLLFPMLALLVVGSVATVKDSVAQEKQDVKQTAEVMPEFPGGKQAMVEFLLENIQYPEEAKKEEVEGKVFVGFLVNKQGEVTNVNVKKNVHPALDKQAVEVVSSMPKWSPGKDGGKAVKVEMVLPIAYKLSDKEKEAK